MREPDKVEQLLAEIRDAQREHLAEYKSVTAQSLELQRRAVERQEQLGRLYRRVVLFGGLLVACLVFLLLYVLSRMR